MTRVSLYSVSSCNRMNITVGWTSCGGTSSRGSARRSRPWRTSTGFCWRTFYRPTWPNTSWDATGRMRRVSLHSRWAVCTHYSRVIHSNQIARFTLIVSRDLWRPFFFLRMNKTDEMVYAKRGHYSAFLPKTLKWNSNKMLFNGKSSLHFFLILISSTPKFTFPI